LNREGKKNALGKSEEVGGGGSHSMTQDVPSQGLIARKIDGDRKPVALEGTEDRRHVKRRKVFIIRDDEQEGWTLKCEATKKQSQGR